MSGAENNESEDTLTPEEIKNMTVEQLRAFREKTLTIEWSMAKQDASQDDRRVAARAAIQAHQAILALGNAELENIGDQLAANGPALRKGTEELKSALKDIESLKGTLGAVKAVLSVVGKIVSIA